MTELEYFLPKIMPYAPGCPDPAALAAIVKAAQDFCERTRIWRDEDCFQVTPTSCNVMCAPQDADVFEIEHATLDGQKLEPISLHDLSRIMPDWREREEGAGKWISQIERGTVLVVPRTSGTLRLSTILKPANDAEQLPDFIAKDHLHTIADGALAEILMTPNQPFSAPDRAQFYSMRFENRLQGLSTTSIKGQQRARLRSQAQWF